MNDFSVRTATPDDLQKIYLMGFDVWSEGKNTRQYLEECRHSVKYQTGEWFLLEENDQILSSLIVYALGEHIFGIGSIATSPALRKKGYASHLVQNVVHTLESADPEAVLFLYADIGPSFYEKLGFTVLPKEAQRYQKTQCMIRGKNITRFIADPRINPEYF